MTDDGGAQERHGDTAAKLAKLFGKQKAEETVAMQYLERYMALLIFSEYLLCKEPLQFTDGNQQVVPTAVASAAPPGVAAGRNRCSVPLSASSESSLSSGVSSDRRVAPLRAPLLIPLLATRWVPRRLRSGPLGLPGHRLRD